MKIIAFSLLIAVMSVGCAGKPVNKPAPAPQPSLVDQKITEVSIDIQRNLRRLADTNNALAIDKMSEDDRRYVNHQANHIPKGMGKRMSINWDGPVEPFLLTLSKEAGYKFKVNGKRPVPNVMVRIYADDVPVVDMLRDAGLQMGDRATVRVLESGRQLELNYADR